MTVSIASRSERKSNFSKDASRTENHTSVERRPTNGKSGRWCMPGAST